PRKAAAASVLWRGHPSLRRRPARRAAAADPVRGDSQARPALRDRGAGEAALFEFHPRHPVNAGEDGELTMVIVIGSEAKQSIAQQVEMWIASSLRSSQ